MSKNRIILELDRYEEGCVIHALNEMRKKQLEEGRSADLINEVLLKTLHALRKKDRGRKRDDTAR